VQGRRTGNGGSDRNLGLGRQKIRMRRRKARPRRRRLRNRSNQRRERWFIEGQMERCRSLHGALGIAVTARDVPKRKLWKLSACVQRTWRLAVSRTNLLSSAAREARLVFGGQNFRASQIVFRVDMLLLLGLVFARLLLAGGCCRILRLLRSATRCAKKQARANKDRQSAAKGLAERHRRVHRMLAATGEVSFHFPTHFEGTIRCRNTTGRHAWCQC